MTKEQSRIRACAMYLMDAYDDFLNAKDENEYDYFGNRYAEALERLSTITGVERSVLESALENHEGCNYNLDWFRNLGFEG